MEKSPDNLPEVRARIDAIDTEILNLLARRVECALEIGEIKKALNKAFFDPARERLIFERLLKQNEKIGSKLTDKNISVIYREIISACRNAEHPLRVAFLGPAGTNTQQAAVQYFGSAFEALPCGTVEEVCREVGREADYGVLAIENSTHGIVAPTLDLLADHDLTICAEIALPIHFCLLSQSSLGEISTVYSHEQGLAQCRKWLAAHIPGAALVPVTSTARGAQLAAAEKDSAAISNSLAAEIYGLQNVAANIEDLATNKTRFFVVGAQDKAPAASGKDKTSLTFLVPHRPGALLEILSCFSKHNINLSMIESRPTRQQMWEYRFFADVQAHRSDPKLQAALEELKHHTVSYKILGSYPESSE
jgi:chorismate mutase/prephenate dehydratase